VSFDFAQDEGSLDVLEGSNTLTSS
jgi:hypothetical protein